MPEEPKVNVDGISAPSTNEEKKKPTPSVKTTESAASSKEVLSRAKFALITLIGLPYLLYFGWSLFLITVLPDASGAWDSIIPIGRVISLVAGVTLLSIGYVAFTRVGKTPNAPDKVRYMSLARIGIVVIPGLLMSAFVPYWIAQEPSLTLDISNPPPTTELVAPISVEFSAENAVEILKRRGLETKSFQWDFNSDGEINDETVTPRSTAFFDRQGGYNVTVTLELSDGSSRRLVKRLVIPNAVFSYTPFVPVVDEPIKFSVSHLIPEGMEVRDVQWDFNDDQIPDESSTALETTYTFLRTGSHRVAVTINYFNQTQNTYIRTLDIQEPLPNPFPISIETTPLFLESPPPFQVVFRLVTDEPLQEVKWDFDDSSPPEVGDRVGHTFRNRRVFQVRATARNMNGQIAKTTKVVKVVENLIIPDLTFDGSHRVSNNQTITAEAPVAITLTPKTTVPLVDFWWETTKATEVTSTDTTLKAIFRDEGTYNLVLLGKDAEGRVMRKVIVLEVKPKSRFVDFEVRPTQPVAPEVVRFDASESFIPGDQITGFIWDFGESKEGNQRFGDAREEFEYTQPGEYTVSLTVNTLSGVTETSTKIITVRAPVLKSCFIMSRNRIKPFSGILFDWKCSTGSPTKVLWRFGDGSEAESNPEDPGKEIDHVFERIGEYNVELLLEDENGSLSTYTQTVFVEQ